MNLIRHRDLIRNVVNRWFSQYGPFTDADKLSVGRFSRSKKYDTYTNLLALDLDVASKSDVDSIIGNCSWVNLVCDECKKSVNTVVQVGKEPDYESHTAELCRECASKVIDEFEGADQ